jgi:CMP-N-acetylneuraminic acid synthetase
MKFLALIPARAGSERVRNKNILPLNGRPLIEHTIKAALGAHYLDRVIVSTDSEEIRKIAIATGAQAPFLRPADLATKDATELAFHLHAVEWLQQNEGYRPDYIVNLYPTTPFRKSYTIDNAIKLIMDSPDADGLRSVVKCSEHPYKMWQRDGKYLKYFVDHPDPNIHTLAYHQLPEVFIQNASIYVIKTDVLLNQKTTIGQKMLHFEMDETESVDINSMLDFEFATFLLNRKH